MKKNRPTDTRELFKSLSEEQQEEFVLKQLKEFSSVTSMLEDLAKSNDPRQTQTPHERSLEEHEAFEAYMTSLHGLHSEIEASPDIDGQTKHEAF